ncbi:hypothetical protein JKP88DRAFT_284586 [Tribonema minus]|uniref:Uncharacterized protein n=1 Tax=Tribonema minus TaxID=303371 RepID=A0A835ZHB2_9STRA|nr:hypothetical protein JKP88DRAFT_284586 [Tribonema minus]
MYLDVADNGLHEFMVREGEYVVCDATGADTIVVGGVSDGIATLMILKDSAGSPLKMAVTHTLPASDEGNTVVAAAAAMIKEAHVHGATLDVLCAGGISYIDEAAANAWLRVDKVTSALRLLCAQYGIDVQEGWHRLAWGGDSSAMHDLTEDDRALIGGIQRRGLGAYYVRNIRCTATGCMLARNVGKLFDGKPLPDGCIAALGDQLSSVAANERAAPQDPLLLEIASRAAALAMGM